MLWVLAWNYFSSFFSSSDVVCPAVTSSAATGSSSAGAGFSGSFAPHFGQKLLSLLVLAPHAVQVTS